MTAWLAAHWWKLAIVGGTVLVAGYFLGRCGRGTTKQELNAAREIGKADAHKQAAEEAAKEAERLKAVAADAGAEVSKAEDVLKAAKERLIEAARKQREMRERLADAGVDVDAIERILNEGEP